MGIADDIYKNAQAGQQQAGQTVGNALEAYGAVERLQNAKQQLEMQKNNNETAKATAFLGQMDSLSRMSPSMQGIALKSMDNTWRQMYPNMSPDFSMALQQDKDFRAKALQVASNAFQTLRNGGQLDAEAINAIPGMDMQTLVGLVNKAQEDYSKKQQAALLAGNRQDLQTQKDTAALERARVVAGEKPTEGQKAADRTFGKEYAEWEAAGGKAAFESNLKKLEDAATALEEGKIKTGGLKGIVGGASDTAQDVLDPDVAALRDDVQGAVQGTLKQVLGAQFTEKEGTKIFNRAFNTRLPPKENARRIRAEADKLRKQGEARAASGEQFRKTGSIAKSSPAGGKQPPGGVTQKRQGGHVYNWNPATGQYE